MPAFFMMMLGAAVLIGYMVHVLAMAIVFDCFTKKFSKKWLLVPIVPYVLYYLFFSLEFFKIQKIEYEARQENPSEIIAYNPDIHSLVYNSNMTEYYKIPVSFSPNVNFPEGYLSYRTLTQNLCKRAKNAKDFTYTSGVGWSTFKNKKYSFKRFTNVCEFRMPEKPTNTLLEVKKEEVGNRKEKLQKIIYTFFLGGEYLGQYTSVSYKRLPYFPKFIIGCGLNSSVAEWQCAFNLMRENKHLDTFPKKSQNYDDYWVVARLLDIEKYTEDELRNFEDYPENKMVLTDLINQKENTTPAEIDEWGLRRDGLYQPNISKFNGYPSLEGVIYHGNKGGPFKKFIKEHEGKIVYLDIEAKPNARKASFQNYGVCKINEKCNSRTDNSYQFKNKDGTAHNFLEEGHFNGFFLVGSEKLFENRYNKGDNDTITILTFIPREELN